MHVGDDEAWVLSSVRVLGLADDTALGRPAPARAILEVGEHASRLPRALRLALGRFHLRCDPGNEPLVAGEPEHVLHAVALAPGHQVVAAEAAVGADDDGGLRPAFADVADNPGDLVRRTVGGIVRRGSELGREQVPATKDVQRQIAVAVVVAVKMPAFLFAVERIVGRIQVDDDVRQRLAMSLQEQIDEQAFDGWPVMIELVVAVLADLAGVFQPVERRLAGERSARPVDDGSERRIVAQSVVVDQVLVA